MASDLRLSVTITKDTVTADLKNRIQQSPAAAAAGLYKLGNVIMTSAKRRTPVKTGVLRGSGYVMTPKADRAGGTVTLGFGGPAKAYAVVQHERLDFKHPNGGEAKYLANAIAEFRGPRGQQIMLDGINAWLKSRTFPAGVNPTTPNAGPRPSGGKGGARRKARTGRTR